MLSLPIPAPATLANAVTAVAVDPATAAAVDGEDFSAVLARGLSANAMEPKPDFVPASTADSEDSSALLALGLVAQAIEPKPDFVPARPEDNASAPAVSGSEMASLQIAAEPATATIALLAPPATMPAALVSSAERHPSQPERHRVRDLLPIPVMVLSAAASTEMSAPRHFPQVTPLDRPAFAPGNITASIAAPGKFLPAFATPEMPSGPGLENQLTQPLPEITAAATSHSSMAPTSHTSSVVVAHVATDGAEASKNLKIETRVGAPGWSGELAEKVVWIANRHQQVAELHLNPPQLGPVEVMVTIGSDPGSQANVQFASPHSAAREALEAALPRLREMLADSGITLGNATVSADSFQQRAETGREEHASMAHAAAADTDSGLAIASGVSLVRSAGNGLVDTFA